MSVNFYIEIYIPAPPEKIYQAWLNGEEHEKMTGGSAIGKPVVGKMYSAWDDYIVGQNIELIPNKKIVQTWRSLEFKEEDEDSKIVIELNAQSGGTLLSLTHTNIPDDQPDYEQGWKEHYFQPMMEYFSENS